MASRHVKGISFTDEYMQEYINLQKESNASKLICELLREYYNSNDYTLKNVKRDLVHIKELLYDVTNMLEVKDYE